jgi:hypothetical protein
MKLAHHITDDRGALTMSDTVSEVQLVLHGVEDATLDGLQPVTNIG